MAKVDERVQIRYELDTQLYEANSIKIIKKQKEIAHSLAQGNITMSQAEKQYAQLSLAQQKLNKVQDLTNTKFKQMGGVVGRRGETVRGLQFFTQQVGFLASDAKYGLLGIGNNLSLLLGLWPQLNAQIKESGKSMGQVIKGALLGPGGILIALQLLIAFGPEIYDFFDGLINGADKTKEALESASEEISKKTAKLRTYAKVLESGNLSIEERTALSRELSKTNKTLIDDNGNLITSTEALTKAVELEKNAVTEKIKFDVIQTKLGETMAKQETLRLGKMTRGLALWELAKAGRLRWGSFWGILFGDKETLDQAYNDLDKLFTDQIQPMLDKFDDLFIQIDKKERADKGVGLVGALLVSDKDKIRQKMKEEQDLLKEALQAGKITHAQYNQANVKLHENANKAILDNDLATTQQRIGIMANFLQQAAQLDQKNKGLAKAAIVANAAVASIGIWRDYHGEKNTIPTPFNSIAAGIQQALLIAATAKSLKSLSSDTALSGSGAGSQAPNLNVIGATGSNQLRDSLEATAAAQTDARVVLVESDLDMKQQDKKVAIEQSSIG